MTKPTSQEIDATLAPLARDPALQMLVRTHVTARIRQILAKSPVPDGVHELLVFAATAGLVDMAAQHLARELRPGGDHPEIIAGLTRLVARLAMNELEAQR